VPEFDYSPTAAAQYLGVHLSTLKRWAREGRVAGFRTPGGHWKFSKADLDAFLAAGRTEPENVA
jgi:excisionase family DNA binding protein